jgi:pimeloyl-ACP methyl ester carboxylesterase
MDALAEMIEQSEGIALSEALRREFDDTDAGQFRLTLAAGAGVADPWDELSSITAQVVLIAGSEEDPDRVQDEMAVRLPRGRSVHVPGCGHVGAFMRPAEVVAAALPTLNGARTS